MRYDDTDSPILSTKFTKKPVVYLLNSTSNHNVLYAITALAALYIFWILHQTTTYLLRCMRPLSCISFESYIKPQLGLEKDRQRTVVYLLNPTSNHNSRILTNYICVLYIFWLLHQTTTLLRITYLLLCCISFDSYIKPQRRWSRENDCRVVYLLTPTSNHNSYPAPLVSWLLYIFWLLHQTTTIVAFNTLKNCCISFDSYIKPQLTSILSCERYSCISFDSYIKPQL